MAKCLIQFDQNEHGTYFTGQVITGHVIVSINKPKKLKGIKLQICGFAAAQWKEKRGKVHSQRKVKRRKKHFYYGREDYIASTTYLIGSEAGQNFIMDAGTYNYTFSCPIPANCPSSFEGAFGHIRYMAKVTTMRCGSSDRTHNIGFTVLKLLDLNQESRLLKAPANNEAMEHFCLFLTQGVTLKVDIAQSGYVPGQIMLVSAHVNNESGFDCQRLAIYINLRATYTSDTPCLRTTSEKICLVKKYCGPVSTGTAKDFAETVRIPATPPTCEHLSKVVRVSYEVCVTAMMGPLMSNPKTIIPITIGNVPLAGINQPMPPQDDLPTTSNCGMQLAEVNDNSSMEDDSFVEVDLPPPTYEEAMFMTTDIADDDVNTVSEATTFTPRYPVYDVDAIVAANVPDTNAPQKRRRRKKKKTNAQPTEQEKTPMESPVEI